MGAVLGDSDGRPPLHIDGGGELQPIGYELPVASAQVKSCILLAGLYAVTGPTTVIEPVPTRDHTERLLRAAGARVAKGPRTRLGVAGRAPAARAASTCPATSPRPRRSSSPRRCWPSRACSCAACRPTRRAPGLLTVLERMGARINLFNRRTTAGGEPIADVEVHPAELVATEIEPEIVPSLIDELPLLALAATMARGRTVVRGAGELRVKESNRLETVAELLRAIGGHVRATDDGWEIQGVPARPEGGRVDAHGDHRIGMLGADRRTRLAQRRARRRRLGDRRLLPRLRARARAPGGAAVVIAIDGPAGAGKSTVARAVADALGYRYLDTGRDVPGGHAGRAARRRRQRRRRRRWPRSRTSRRRMTGDRRAAQPRGRAQRLAASRATREVRDALHGAQRAFLAAGRRRGRGPRRRRGRLAGGRAQDLARRRRRDVRARRRVRGAGRRVGRGGAGRARRARRGADGARARRGRDRQHRSRPRTRSSPASSSWRAERRP